MFCDKLAQDGSGVPVIVAILVGLITGVACGAFSGLFIAIANIPAFIATLATCTIACGIVFVFTDGRPITGVSDAYKYMGRTSWGPVPVMVVILFTVSRCRYISIKIYQIWKTWLCNRVSATKEQHLYPVCQCQNDRIPCICNQWILCSICRTFNTFPTYSDWAASRW